MLDQNLDEDSLSCFLYILLLSFCWAPLGWMLPFHLAYNPCSALLTVVEYSLALVSQFRSSLSKHTPAFHTNWLNVLNLKILFLMWVFCTAGFIPNKKKNRVRKLFLKLSTEQQTSVGPSSPQSSFPPHPPLHSTSSDPCSSVNLSFVILRCSLHSVYSCHHLTFIFSPPS